MNKALPVLLAAALAAGGAAATTARAGGGDNVVVATNTRDGSNVYRFSFKVVRVAHDPVDNANAAVAAASCTSCETTAVAFQILIVTNDTHDFEPVNLAIALNVDCTDCETLASAYQWVFQTNGVQPHLTADGNRRLAEVRRAAEELRHADLSIWDLQARIQQLADEVYAVYRDDLVLPR